MSPDTVTAGDLASLRCFAHLGSSVLERMAGCGRRRDVAAGERLAAEGDEADRFYAVVDGRLAIAVRRRSGGELIVGTVEPGELAGFSWYLAPHRWRFDVVAAGGSTVVDFDAAGVRAVLGEHPDAALEITRRLADMLAHRLESARLQLMDLYGRAPD